MFWLNFPFLRPLCLLAAGIFLAGHCQPAWPPYSGYAFLVAGYLFFLFIGRYAPLLLPFLWLVLGYGMCVIHQSVPPARMPEAGRLTIDRKEYTSSERWNRYLAVIGAQRRDGKWFNEHLSVHLYVPKSDTLETGDQLVFRGQIKRPDPPLHEFAFDYGRFLAIEGVVGQLYLSDDFRRTGKQLALRHRVILLQDWVRSRIEEWIQNPDHARLLTGMVLGEKRGLSEEVRQAYAVTGSMHVLAVSGLHVGLIYFLINAVLSFFSQKYPWPLVRYVLILVMLIAYAALAGFSPSVIRAVVFILLFLLSRLLQRPNPLPHVFYLTAFLMLLTDPMQIFSVSFQLSFMAVFGIMMLMPWLEPLFSHPLKVPDYLLKNVSMSIAVQASTFMLSIHYFHQLSFSFWIAATIVVPATFLVLVLTIILFLVHPIQVLQEAVSAVISWLLENVTLGLQWLAKVPYGHVSQVYWPIWLTGSLAIILYITGQSARRKHRSGLYISLVCLLTWMLGFVYADRQVDHQENTVVHLTAERELYVLRIQGRKGILWGPESGDLQETGEIRMEHQSWFTGHGVRTIEHRALPSTTGATIKIDGVTMVFWVKSDNFPLSGYCLALQYGQGSDTLCTGNGQEIFQKIPQFNESDRSI